MPDRHIEYVRLDQVEEAPRNPKLHAPDLARSIGHFGFAEIPLRDDRTGRLVAGHGRFHELRDRHAAGKQPPDGVRVDEDGMWRMPIVHGWSSRSDEDAEAYLIGSNYLPAKGGWDNQGLADMAQDLAAAQLLDVTGMDPGDLDKLLTGLDGDTPDDAEPPETADALAGTEDTYREQYGVIVMCDTETDQQQTYEDLQAQGYRCRVVTT